jgi:acetylornithine deacetylase/succinyl-diaminopimelate desuccinylase-like protein
MPCVGCSIFVSRWQGEQLEIGLRDSALWQDGGDALERLTLLVDHLRGGVLAGVDVNVGRLEAGQRAGGVPAGARAEIRLLFDGDYTWRGLMDAVTREVNAYPQRSDDAGHSFSVSAEPLGMRSNPGAVPWDAPSTRTLRSAIEAINGQAPASYPNHYGGDIRYPLRLLDAPAFGIGSLGGNFYGPNEWVDIDDLVRLVAVVILTLSNWTAGK